MPGDQTDILSALGLAPPREPDAPSPGVFDAAPLFVAPRTMRGQLALPTSEDQTGS